LAQLRGAQQFLQAGGLGFDVTAIRPAQRRGDLRAGQPGSTVGIRAAAQ
jgi:hypothetical protein